MRSKVMVLVSIKSTVFRNETLHNLVDRY